MSGKNIIKKVHMYIEQNLDKNLSLTALADLANYSPSYFSRFYKQATGKSISEYIWEIKFQKAKYYLRTSEMKIYEIAQSLGFNTSSYFTFFFKKYINMSPQEYRDLGV